MVLLTYFLKQPVWFQGFGQDRLPKDVMPQVGVPGRVRGGCLLPSEGGRGPRAPLGQGSCSCPPCVPRQGKVESLGCLGCL